MLASRNADVLIDLTTPEVGMYHAKTALKYNVVPLLAPRDYETGFRRNWNNLPEKELGCIIAPNFAIGAVLMMKFSQMAAKYFRMLKLLKCIMIKNLMPRREQR